MKIKLKKCTFNESAIIGTAKVPSNDAVLYAKKVSRNLSNNQLVALDDFVNNLKTNGIWEKLTHLYIPSLAFVDGGENLREAFIDVVSSFGSTTTYGIDEELAKSEFIYKDDGITNKTAKLNNIRRGAAFINGETINDSHAMFYIKSGEHSASQAGIENAWDRGFTCGITNAPYKYENIHNIVVVKNSIGFNFDPTEAIKAGEIFGHIALNNNGKRITASIIDNNGFDISSLNTFPENIMFGTSEIQISFGLVSFGKGLTKDEATKYIQYIKELMSKV